MNHRSTALTLIALVLACLTGATVGQRRQEKPENYFDDVYHCANPNRPNYDIPCDPETFLWDLDALNPKRSPTDSVLCDEVVNILARAQEEFPISGPNGDQASIELWETIMDTAVVDQLEPCVLWAMKYGRLAPYAESIGVYQKEMGGGNNQQHHVKINDNSDPTNSLLDGTEFDPIVIALAWKDALPEPLSLDRTQLHDLTGRHMLDALKAELGPEKVEVLDLTVTAGLPDYQARILPLTLSGKVKFTNQHREALGPTSLQQLLMQSAFVNKNAKELYEFRLKITDDSVLSNVDSILAGKEEMTNYILNAPAYYANSSSSSGSSNSDTETDLSNEDGGVASSLLVGILIAVGIAIIAVVCLSYFLIFKPRNFDDKLLLDENSANSVTGHEYSGSETGKQNQLAKPTKLAFDGDGVPQVSTAPTGSQEEEGEEYDIEYMAGSQVDDEVSDYEMDDTVIPQVNLPEDTDDDDDEADQMSVMDGFEDEITDEGGEADEASDHSQASGDNYSYIPDDTSLTFSLEEKLKEEAKKKDKPDFFVALKPEGQEPPETDDGSKNHRGQPRSPRTSLKSPNSILGPTSDDDDQSHDSKELLYATDDDTNIFTTADDDTNMYATDDDTNISNSVGIPHSYSTDAEDTHSQPTTEPKQKQNSPIESIPADLGERNTQFDDLWKDENELDEAASVLNYLENVQSARREAQANEAQAEEAQANDDEANDDEAIEDYANEEPPSSMEIVDVATPVQTPEQPSQEIGDDVVESYGKILSEPLVDRLPETSTDEDDAMNVPLPATLDTNSGQETTSEASNKSEPRAPFTKGQSVRRKNSNKWTSDSTSVASEKDDSSVQSDRSTESSMLRKLLGQSDVNDSALSSFGKQMQSTKGDNSSAASNTATPEAPKLQSLLTAHDSDDEPEELLFNETSGIQEEKKVADDDEGKNNYLPTSITPRNASPSRGVTSPDDATVASALSDAPTVDASIASDMGWF